MTVALVGIPSNDAALAWCLVDEWIAKACEENPAELEADEIRDACKDGGMQLWLAWDAQAQEPLACMVTSLQKGRDASLFAKIHILTGRQIDRWASLIDEFKRVSKDHGISRIVALARPGYRRVFKTTGAELRHIELVWEL